MGKVVREAGEEGAVEEKAQEETRIKSQQEDSFMGRIKKNTILYIGALGGLNLSMNTIHSTGFGVGAAIDIVALRHYGLHLGVETGQYAVKAAKLSSGNNILTFNEPGTLGFFSIDALPFYALPKFAGIDSAVGGGIAVYKLKGGTYDFTSVVAPKFFVAAHYTIFARLQIGLMWSITLASASKLSSNGGDFELDLNQNLTTMGVQLSIRYAFW